MVITIIMPAYNAELYIFESIQSILRQTFDSWELIIINDGSTDKTLNIIETIDDPRIHLIDKKINGGVGAARNSGLSSAKGKYITFVDADDILPPESLAVRVNCLDSNPEIDLVDGRVLVKDINMNNNVRVYEPYYSGKLLPRLLALDSRVFFGVCYMFKRSLLENIRFNEKMTHSEDLLFYIELSHRHSIRYGFVSENIYWYRSGGESAMSNLDGLEKGYLMVINQLNNLKNVSLIQQGEFRFKVARILFLSWLKSKNFLRAFYAAFVTLFVFNNKAI